MNKLFKSALGLIVLALATPSAASAQEMPPIPVDPAVKIGKLDNGLTYYIRHNEYPKGQASFFIAQKVGSVQEEDNQRGLAHFLEHMCFNGTQNFPGNELVSWLETVGVKFGANLNAYTSTDETVYYISKVPTAREGVVDSCLVILHDWADGLLLEPEEIDKERDVIHQEWRRSNVGQMRIIETLLPVIYPGSRYAYRLPIGTMEVVDNFPYQALRDYYEKWYRPDLQGIIVVGDIDVDKVEASIKNIFGGIKMPENPAERVYYPVPDTQGTIFAIGKDPEQDRALVEIYFKSEAIPDEAKGTLDYMLATYAMSMASSMLDARLSDMMSKPDTPFGAANAGYGKYFMSKTSDAFTVSGLGKGDDILPTFETIYREALRVKRGGFTATEYDRARSEYLSRLEKAKNNANSIESTSLGFEYVRNFLDNEPIPGVETEYELMSMIVPQIPVQMINLAIADVLGDNNRIVMAVLPEKEGYKVPTEEEMAEVMKRVDAEQIDPFVDEVKAEPLIPVLPKPGKIKKTETDNLYGTTVWTLSNGAKVVIKTTDFKEDEILFTAVAMGGTSSLDHSFDNDLVYLQYAMSQSGLGDYTSSDMEKYLSGKQASANLSISDTKRAIAGNSTPKDLPTLMELIYMNFTGFNITPDEFAATQELYRGVLHNSESEPSYLFEKKLNEFMSTSGRNRILDTSIIDAANLQRTLDIVHDQLADVQDFTFIFVGKVTPEELKPLVEQYIASIPAGKSKAGVNFDNLGSIKSSATEIVEQAMSTPQSTAAIFMSGDLPFTAKNAALASMAGQILSARLIKKVREEMGAVYSISASGKMDPVSDLPVTVYSVFPLKPEMRDQVLATIRAEIEDMTKNVNAEELGKVKEYMLKNNTELMAKNNGWMGAIVGYTLVPVERFLGMTEVYNAITEADIQQFMADVLNQNIYRVFVQDPAPAPAE